MSGGLRLSPDEDISPDESSGVGVTLDRGALRRWNSSELEWLWRGRYHLQATTAKLQLAARSDHLSGEPHARQPVSRTMQCQWRGAGLRDQSRAIRHRQFGSQFPPADHCADSYRSGHGWWQP